MPVTVDFEFTILGTVMNIHSLFIKQMFKCLGSGLDSRNNMANKTDTISTFREADRDLVTKHSFI